MRARRGAVALVHRIVAAAVTFVGAHRASALRAFSGLPPKHERPTPQLSREDMKVALQRGGTERDEYDEGERVEGLGLAPYAQSSPRPRS